MVAAQQSLLVSKPCEYGQKTSRPPNERRNRKEYETLTCTRSLALFLLKDFGCRQHISRSWPRKSVQTLIRRAFFLPYQLEPGGSNRSTGRKISRLIICNVQPSEAYRFITNSERREDVLASATQPLTAKQIARKTGLTFDACREVVRDLAACGLLRCLNPSARRSRLYWLTKPGKACQRHLFETRQEKLPAHFVPAIDWALYGWVCFSHRSAIIKTLTRPMQPATIKRKARTRDAHLWMSANNVRDVIRLVMERGIVERLPGRKKSSHPQYQVTEEGYKLRVLMLRANEGARNHQEGDLM